MRKVVMIMLAILVTASLSAQNKLDKVKAPTSPGASVIGIQPTTILTPKSYEALEAALFTNYVDDNGSFLIPNDIGLEFTPYWMKSHKMSTDEYLFPDPWVSLVRNLSFSVATTNNYYLGDSVATNALGLGFRTSMYFPSEKLRAQADKLLTPLRVSNRLAAMIIEYSKGVIKKLDNDMNKENFISSLMILIEEINKTEYYFKTDEECKQALDQLAGVLREKLPVWDDNRQDYIIVLDNALEDAFYIPDKYDKMQDFIVHRPGLRLDFAGALALNFPTNQFTYSIVPKNSLWLTLSYRFKNDAKWSINLLGVLNYNWYDHHFFDKYLPEQKYFDHNWDYGFGLNFMYEKFTAQLEMVGRKSQAVFDQTTDDQGVTTKSYKTETDFQYIANLSYQIADGLIVTYSIGNRFEPVLTYYGTLVSTLTLNFGFGGPTEREFK